MSSKNPETSSLLQRWLLENNELANKWKHQDGGDTLSLEQGRLRCYSAEFHKLLSKIQGVPPLADLVHLELTVAYNTCVYSLALTQFSTTELLVSHALERALQVSGVVPVDSGSLGLWPSALKSCGDEALRLSIQRLLCVQWAIWCATCKLETVEEFRDELSSLPEVLQADIQEDRKCTKIPRVVLDPRRLGGLLRVCTVIAQGAERLREGRSSEALSVLQRAASLPAPRRLLAYIHHLSGSCLAHMERPQMALQCYRKALETDLGCVCALYQSMLIYRKLDNTQAEVQALRLLHSTLLLPLVPDLVLSDTRPLVPSLLLSSQALKDVLSVPSALTVLHDLALKCVLHGRVSEGVEHYLVLLAALRSEDQGVSNEKHHLPRLPELYLEAGAALLLAQRPADCITLCDEMVSMTLEVLPARLVLEETFEEGCAAAWEPHRGSDKRDQFAMLLWTGAAYLLQGHCHTQLEDWKQAVTHYTRCMNLLVKVQFKKTGAQPHTTHTGAVAKQDPDQKGASRSGLQRLKGLSLAGRGVGFIQTNQLREALRDLQHSLEAFPECMGAGLWCGEVLWRMGRRREAAARWEKTWSVRTQSSPDLPLYLKEPQTGPVLNPTELRQRIEDFTQTEPAQRRIGEE